MSSGGPRPTIGGLRSLALAVLLLELRPDGYGWRFSSTAGGSFSDGGSGTCH
jgi:hypothetical protein